LKKLGFHTKAVQGVSPVEKTHGGVATPIYQVSTFAFRNAAQGKALFDGEEKGFIYTRLGNPTNEKLEKNLAYLEGADAGLSFSSGMAAITCAVLQYAGAGDHVVSVETLYGGTYDLFANRLPCLGVEVEFVDEKPEAFADAIRDDTKLLYLETPTNPLLAVVDIAAVAGVAKDAGIPLVVDNTFATPYLQQPLALGADVVVHSGTKYIGGHGDAIGGFIVGPEDVINDMRAGIYKDFGAAPSPFNSFLFLRGLKTLPLRMDRHCENAGRIAEFLDGHPKVNKVYYPGLPDHPGHETAKKQMRGFGGMLGFEVADFNTACKFLDSLEVCVQAVSLGDVVTLIEHPASTTHHAYSPEELAEIGLAQGYIRLSVGIEDADDLIADLEAGLSEI
jgi:methionine-gamma-lyase